MNKRRTLGRGLASLIPDAAGAEMEGGPRAALAAGAVVHIPIDEIRANPFQPRRHFAEEPLAELVASIKEKGVIQPILLRPVDGGYEIVAGERRYRASCKAGLRTIPSIVRRMGTTESLELALIENLQREDLNAVEEAEAYKQLIEDVGYTQEELAGKVGKDRSTVANMLRLLKLPEVALDGLVRGALTMGHGRALLGLKDEELILGLYARVVNESLSVRQTEEEVRQLQEGRRTRKTIKELPDGLVNVQDRLARHLGTRVQVKPRARGGGGKIVLDYYNSQDLDRLLGRLESPLL
ncbi:MAG: ParB/RepB/Spo0J family partition protein [Deltaproteobacteria bacterium]|nr:ParB/RepB/Spo0J family partition protein [Deltaproteobacteria bacterium]